MLDKKQIKTNKDKCIFFTANTSWYLYNFRKNTISKFLKKKFKVVCIAPKDAYSSKLEQLGAIYINLPLNSSSTNIINETKSFFYILRILRSFEPFIVFNFTIKMNLYFGVACRFFSIPYVNNVSGLGTVFLHEKFIYKFARIFYGFSNNGSLRTFFQNYEDRKLMLSMNLADSAKSVLLPGSGVDLKYFNFHDMPKNNSFTFTMVSRLIADKGVREFIESARIIKKKYPEVNFILVGPAGISNKSAIKAEEIKNWSSDNIVKWVGEQSNVKSWLVNTNVLVLPSYREGMPKTVIEAAAIGRPSIVSDVPGCRQAIIDGQTGWLCQVKNVHSLANKMELVLETPHEALCSFGKEARKMAEKRYDEKIVIDKYLECLNI